ncbi:hypothetical protein HC928_11465 [bacterium]|nr:hypothetical protein [bacterium]
MSTQEQKLADVVVSSYEPTPLSLKSDGMSQRARGMSHEERELRNSSREDSEPSVLVEIPRSLTERIRSIGRVLALPTTKLYNSSIQYVVSYSEAKGIKVSEIEGYPKDSILDSENLTRSEIKLSGKVYEELNERDLLPEVSKCVILGIDLLYHRLIEVDGLR